MQLKALLLAVATISTVTQAAPPHTSFILQSNQPQAPPLQTLLLRAEDGTTFALRPVQSQTANNDPPTVTITAQGDLIRGATTQQQQQQHQEQFPVIVVNRRHFDSFADPSAPAQTQQGQQVVFLQRPQTNAALIQGDAELNNNNNDIIALQATRIEPSRDQESQSPVISIRRSDLEAILARNQGNAGAQQAQQTSVLTLRPVVQADNTQGFVLQAAQVPQTQGSQVFAFQGQHQQPQAVVRLAPAVTQHQAAPQPAQQVPQQTSAQAQQSGSFTPFTFPIHPLHSALAFPQFNTAAANQFLNGPQGPVVPVHNVQQQNQHRSSSHRDREREERNS